MAAPGAHLAILEPTRAGPAHRALIGPLALLVLAACPGDRDGSDPVLSREGEHSRVMVEVLNAASRRGLARIGTRVLREAGLDVVYFGNADAVRDTTLILVRRGRSLAPGERVARALGRGRVERREDTLRRVDVTVLLGRDWVAPPDPRP